eukprot:scaffold85309_cov63-Phaeocystis_antarctica.AAC.3
MLYGLLQTTDYHKGIADTWRKHQDPCTRCVHAELRLRSYGDLLEIYCGEGALAKKRVAMLRTEKTRAAFSALPSLGASSTALTFFPLIRPPRRAEMPAW